MNTFSTSPSQNMDSEQHNILESMPYNPKNKLLSNEDLTSLLRDNGITMDFHDLNLYRMAFVQKSYCTRKNENFINGNTKCPSSCLALQECSNERLEFLGDSVLNLIVANYLYERFPESEEGFLTRIRTKLVNGKMLAVLSDKIGLQRYVMISKQIEDNGGRKNQKILEDTFEAFLGALFLDFKEDGFAVSHDFIVNILEDNIDFSELITSHHNYKDMLLKHFQHTHNYLPKFYELNIENKQNGKEYTICIKNKENMVISTGIGPSKKQAECQASYNALLYYGVL